MDPWVWAVLLLTVGAGLAVLEIFFPSAGLLGVLAACALLGAIFLGFQQGPVVGFLILTTALVGLPVVVVLAFHYWPKTAIGRRVLLMTPTSEDVLPEDAETEELKSYVGRVAQTKCKMLPAGAITIDGRTVDAISEGMPIEAGQKVRVVEVSAHRVVVRRLDEDEISETSEDPLRRPVVDPFDQ